MRLKYTRLALTEINAVLDVSRRQYSNRSERTARSVESAISRLLDNPQIGRSGRIEGTRELFLRHLPFVPVYRIGRDALQIAGLRHTARDGPAGFPET